MIELKIQYPFIDENGNAHFDLIKTYSEDENGVFHNVKQIETGVEYGSAVDVVVVYVDEKGEKKYKPKFFSYVAVEIKVEEEKEE